MGHEIREWDTVEGRSQAWHGLSVVREDLTLENSHLNDWDYTPRPVMIESEGGKMVKLPFSVLGVSDVPELCVGRPYNDTTFKPVLNKVLLAKVAKAIQDEGLTLESCGTVMNRGRLFLSFGLDAAKFQAAGRDFRSFLNIGNGNDMSSPLWVNTSNTCTVCSNTFSINMLDKGCVLKVKKTKYSELEISEIGTAIKTMLREQKEFARTLNQLAKIECDEPMAREFFAGFVCENHEEPLSTRAINTIETLVGLFKTGAGNDGNGFDDLWQSITDYFTHLSASGDDSAKARWKNYISSEFGSGKAKKTEAWAIVTDEKQRKAYIKMGKHVLSVTAKALREEAKTEKERETKAKTKTAKENAPETPTDAANTTPETDKQSEVPAATVPV